MNAVLQWVTAVGVFLTGAAAVVAVFRTGKVRQDLSTGNGRTLGQTASAIAAATGVAVHAAEEVAPIVEQAIEKPPAQKP